MSSEKEKDVPYAHELYGRMLDSVLVDGKRLGSILVDGKYNFWDVFAHIVFFDDCVRFSETRRYDSVRRYYDRANRGSFRGSAFFIGLAFFLATIGSLLFVSLLRKKVLIFSVDKDSAKKYNADFRIGEIYALLQENHVSYVEFFHTIVRTSSIVRFIKRRRASMYLEGIDWLYFVLRALRRVFIRRNKELVISGTDSFSTDEKLFVQALITKYVSVAPLVRFRIRFMKTMLRMSNVKLVLGIDDARYYHELSACAKELNIPFYVFQHGSGHYTPYHVGWLTDGRLEGERMYPSDLVVWNEYWKSQLGKLMAVWDDPHIHIGGNAKVGTGLGLTRGGETDPVLIPYETDASRELVRRCVEELGLLGISVLFKLRPDVSRVLQEDILRGVSANVMYVTEVTVPVSAVIGVYSTMLYEAVGDGIPSGVITSPLLYAQGLVASGLCNSISLETLALDMQRLRSLSEEELRQRSGIAKPVSFKMFFERILKEHNIV